MFRLSWFLLVFLHGALLAAEAPDAFQIAVVDAETGRGVPLVELRTVTNQRCVTDSAGLVAVRQPELLGQNVYFHVRSHGYEFPADGFGYRGKALQATPGGSATRERAAGRITIRSKTA